MKLESIWWMHRESKENLIQIIKIKWIKSTNNLSNLKYYNKSKNMDKNRLIEEKNRIIDEQE